MVSSRTWIYVRVGCMLLASASAPFAKVPLHIDFLHPAPWRFIVELLGFVVFGVLFVISLSLRRQDDGELSRPSWSVNPFQISQSLAFYDFAAFTVTAYSFGLAGAQMLSGETNWFWEIPLTAGLGVWLGVRISMVLFKNKLIQPTKAEDHVVPNHLPDPTSPSVTPPADAGGAPSVAADH